jgi:hypothetical protein
MARRRENARLRRAAECADERRQIHWVGQALLLGPWTPRPILVDCYAEGRRIELRVEGAPAAVRRPVALALRRAVRQLAEAAAGPEKGSPRQIAQAGRSPAGGLLIRPPQENPFA